ncbi:4394_t:CDS:1, partial [Acaulospora colombiana]
GILPPASGNEPFLPEVNDDDEKSKLAMSLSYSGHHIPGRYLCVIVEPYPPLPPEQLPRASTVEPPEVRFRTGPAVPILQGVNNVPLSSRAGSVRFRSTTPLFLPENEDDGVTEIPSGHGGQTRVLPPVPLFGRVERDEGDSDGEAGKGLLAFSQALAQVGHEEGGDDSDEDYLRGDADENPRMLD